MIPLNEKEQPNCAILIGEELALLPSKMILGPVSYLDCIVFCVFLAPQLLVHVGLVETLGVILRCLPFLCKAPSYLLHESRLWDNETLGKGDSVKVKK